MISQRFLLGLTCLATILASCGYNPNDDDAFSYAAGFALDQMYAGDPMNYWCGGEGDAASWYRVDVSDLGSTHYRVIGATKAIDLNCIYRVSYFAATVRYDSNSDKWLLIEDIYFSDPCVVVGEGNSPCTDWKYRWKPDMSWRPPNSVVDPLLPTSPSDSESGPQLTALAGTIEALSTELVEIGSTTTENTAISTPVEVADCFGLRMTGFSSQGNQVSWSIENSTGSQAWIAAIGFMWMGNNAPQEVELGGRVWLDEDEIAALINATDPEVSDDPRATIPDDTIRSLSIKHLFGPFDDGRYTLDLLFQVGSTQCLVQTEY